MQQTFRYPNVPSSRRSTGHRQQHALENGLDGSEVGFAQVQRLDWSDPVETSLCK
jgi:hypothetical protein